MDRIHHETYLLSRLLSVVSILVVSSNELSVAQSQPSQVISARDLGLRSGPMVGYSELTEVALWVQTVYPAHVQFRYWPESQLGATMAALSPSIQTTREGDCIAQVVLSGLKSGTKYNYELYVDGRLINRPYRTSFQTQAFWQWRTEPPAFTVAIGSCAYINEEEFDRPGAPYGGEYEIFTAIAAKKPEVMLWLGDNVYYREPEFYSAAQMRHRYEHDRALPEWQALLGETHNYAIWDDHDFGPNNSDGTYRMKKDALAIFKSYWANPAYGLDEAPGVFFNFTWGDVDFFMLDDRYHRSPDDAPASPDKAMFGAAQISWLKNALVSSRAPFKIIAGGNQMLNPQISEESFGAYKNEQTDLLNWIKTNKIPGVLFLSGDVHRTELIRLDDPGFYPLYDYSCSPLTAGTYAPDRMKENPAVVNGTRVVGKRNFGLLRFEGPRKDRKLTMECYDKTGKLIWKHEVKETELQMK
jgi:alkaline phosphatase D